jgi:hypothetical protein
MGMFDTMIVNVNILPDIDDMERIQLKLEEFQTKDFENILTNIYIVDDIKRKKFLPYKLQIEEFNYETVPKKDRRYPDDKGVRGLAGSMKKVNQKIVDSDFTGEFRFYTYVMDNLYEFIGVAKNGKLTDLRKLKDLDEMRDDKINEILN